MAERACLSAEVNIIFVVVKFAIFSQLFSFSFQEEFGLVSATKMAS
jgi:hypothetical protein